MNYKTYAEAKIANPDCEIVTTGKDWAFEKSLKGVFQALGDSDGLRHSVGDDAWVICNPADYCSSLKEFFDDKLMLDIGDKILSKSGKAHVVKSWISFVDCKKEDGYILSAAALNGGCKISANSEQWTIYNNTLPLRELTDEQYGKMRRAYEAGGKVKFSDTPENDDWEDLTLIIPSWKPINIYRIKSKSERELFIDKSKSIIGATTDEELVGAVIADLFDAGARYTDLTQFFGENI